MSTTTIMPFLNDQQPEASSVSIHSTDINWTSKTSRSHTYTSGLKGSVQNFFKNRKRKRESVSPSPPSSSVSTSSKTIQNPAGSPTISRLTTKPGQTQMEVSLPISPITYRPARRRASTLSRELLPPLEFSFSELKKAVVLPRCHPQCKEHCVSQQDPEPGFRVLRRARSAEKCFMISLPLYSAKHNSPLVTNKTFTIYFEVQIRSGDDDGEVGLALGFVAGKARASRLPGFEKGSVGMQCRDGKFYLNGRLVECLATREFEPYQRVGVGMTFSRAFEDAPAMTTSSSAIDVELFLSRDGKKIKGLNLRDQVDLSDTLLSEGLEGAHDLYAVIGTAGKANVDILFEQEHWKYNPKTG